MVWNYQFLNVNGTAVEVSGLITNFIQRFTGNAEIKTNHYYKKGPVCLTVRSNWNFD